MSLTTSAVCGQDRGWYECLCFFLGHQKFVQPETNSPRNYVWLCSATEFFFWSFRKGIPTLRRSSNSVGPALRSHNVGERKWLSGHFLQTREGVFSIEINEVAPVKSQVEMAVFLFGRRWWETNANVIKSQLQRGQHKDNLRLETLPRTLSFLEDEFLSCKWQWGRDRDCLDEQGAIDPMWFGMEYQQCEQHLQSGGCGCKMWALIVEHLEWIRTEEMEVMRA